MFTSEGDTSFKSPLQLADLLSSSVGNIQRYQAGIQTKTLTTTKPFSGFNQIWGGEGMRTCDWLVFVRLTAPLKSEKRTPSKQRNQFLLS